jgi:hypothetical protein
VSGGAVYQHKIWDYKGDCMTVSDPSTDEVLTFSVEQRTIEGDPDHRIVLLTPVARVPYPACLYLTGHAPLTRKKYGSGEYRHMFDPLTKVLSLATDGAYSSVEISVDVYNAIRERIRAKNGLPLVSDVEKYLSQQKDVDAVLKAPLLYSLMDTEFKPNVVSTSSVGVSYQPFNVNHAAEIISEDGKPKGRAVSQPLFAKPALMPTKSISSDISSVEGRVNKPRNDKDPPSYIKHLKSEFVQLLIGKLAGTGSSITTEEVAEKQNKKAQRGRFENAKHYFSENVVGSLKTFIKAEGYASPNDPRTITQVPQEVTTLLSEYTYAFKEAVLKTQAWYGPGKTPLETLDRLGLLTTKDGVITTDFSRFDGSISEFLQSVAKAGYMSFFAPAERRRLGNLYRAIFTRTAFTECGLKYDAGHGTRSGSPITTDANTMINAFVMYCALRKLKLSKEEAMANIGLACGDDGYMTNRPGLKEALEAVCKDLGLQLKPEVHVEGPYPYLGRFFCDPATTKTSFQDPMRTMAKIHLTANSQVPDSQARVNKCLGYLTTDTLTPIIGDYCRLSCKATDGDDDGTDYGGKALTGEEAFKLTMAWPQDPNDQDLINQQVAKLCSLECHELATMVETLRGCTSYKDVPVLFDVERNTKIVAEVSGDIEHPVETHTMNEISNESESKGPATSNPAPPAEVPASTSEACRRSNAEVGRPEPVKKTARDASTNTKSSTNSSGGRNAKRSASGRNPRGGAPSGQVAPSPGRNARPECGTQKPRGGPPGVPKKHIHFAGDSKKPPLMAVQKHGLGSGRKSQ